MTGRVAIAGLGLVTPYGHGVGAFWEALLGGTVALSPAGDPGVTGTPDVPVGQVDRRTTACRGAGVSAADGHGRQEGGRGGHRAAMLRAAMCQALPGGVMPPGSWLIFAGELSRLHPGVPADAPDFIDAPPPDALLSEAAESVGLSHACASALFGLNLAKEAIEGGLTRYAAVVGAFVLNRFICQSMNVVRAVSPTPARPFDVDRAGISIGEGAGAIVLRAAEAGDGLLLAGASCRISGSSPSALDAEEARACMEGALEQARRAPTLVQAHATGTVQGDVAELAAVSAVARHRGLDGLPVASHKGGIGHLLTASAFPGVAAAVLALRTGVVPPTPGLERPDWEEGTLALPRRPVRVGAGGCALVNAFGFGGNNASVALTLD